MRLLKNSVRNNTCYFSSKAKALSPTKHALFFGLVNSASFVQNAADGERRENMRRPDALSGSATLRAGWPLGYMPGLALPASYI